MDTNVLLLLLLTFVPPFLCQNWSTRFRNPYIQFSVRRLCWTASCGGLEQVCDVNTFPCLVPPCPKYPTCFQTNGSIQKGGMCPRPWNIRSDDVACNTDWACTGSLICCHGFYGSACVTGATPALP